MASYDTVQEVINRAAVELGLDPSVDVLASTNSAFIQLRYLFDTAGRELVEKFNWQELQKEHSITTTALDSGEYDLPSDFDHMIDQSGWDRANDNPILGPVTPQIWQYIKGSNLVGSTVYVHFRLKDRKFKIFPDNPVPAGLQIYFEYIKNTWVVKADGSVFYTKANAITDVVLLPFNVIKNYLKVKFLEAKGFDSEKARDDFAESFDLGAGLNAGAPILNMSGHRGTIRLLNLDNFPDSGYGA